MSEPTKESEGGSTRSTDFDVAAVGKVVREELDRQTKYFDFAQGQIEKDRAFYKHLYTFTGAFIALLGAIVGILFYKSVSDMRTDMKAAVDAELVILRAQVAATGVEAHATVNGEMTNVRAEVQKKIDTEFQSDNIAAIVAAAAKVRTDRELSGIIRREVTARLAPRILSDPQARIISESLRSKPDVQLFIRTGNLPEQQGYARKIFHAIQASPSWKEHVSYAEPGTFDGMSDSVTLLLEGIVVVVSDIAHSPESARELETALKNAGIAGVRLDVCAGCQSAPKQPGIVLFVGEKNYELP